MRTLALAAVATAIAAAAPAAAAEQNRAERGIGAYESGQEVYDFDFFLEEKHPFPGTYATPSRRTGERPHLPSREIGPEDPTPLQDPAEPGEPPEAAESTQ